MAYTFTVAGWQDWDGNRSDGDPDELADTQGLFIHAYDPDQTETDHWFWAYVGGPFKDWDEWWILVGALMDMHGMSIA